jgi:hypothetical protein
MHSGVLFHVSFRGLLDDRKQRGTDRVENPVVASNFAACPLLPYSRVAAVDAAQIRFPL